MSSTRLFSMIQDRGIRDVWVYKTQWMLCWLRGDWQMMMSLSFISQLVSCKSSESTCCSWLFMLFLLGRWYLTWPIALHLFQLVLLVDLIVILTRLQRDEEDMSELVRNCPAEFKEYYIQMQAAKRSQAPLPSQVNGACFCKDSSMWWYYRSMVGFVGILYKLVLML